MTSRCWCWPSEALGTVVVNVDDKQKGRIAEMAVMRECVRLGIGVSQPLDVVRYDLILDRRPQRVRVQCK